MEATRSVVVAAAVVGAVTLGVAACTTADHSPGSSTRPGSAGSAAPHATSPPRPIQTPPAAQAQPSPRTTAPPASRVRTGSPQSPAIGPGQFRLVVSMGSNTITANVSSISVSSNQPVDPPHETAQQWNTAVWVKQSTYPSTPGKGTAYVYGHACHYHVCPFTNLRDARTGDQVHVSTSARASTYTIERIGLSPKSASSLPTWAADSTVPDRIVLVTCAYEQGDTSTDNIVVVARLNR